MIQKRILFLGASLQQLPAIEYALLVGCYVITCDYLPENPGHKLAHEWHNVSTTDKIAVLELAKRLNIDGIVAYASDPASPTQAFVAEKLGLPGNSFKSIITLARKDLFRSFMKQHGFYTPKFKVFDSICDAGDWLTSIELPVIIKPVDSSGSKGVSKVITYESIDNALSHAMQYSRVKKIIVEECIKKKGMQISGDGFYENGSLTFIPGNQHNNARLNALAPVGASFPSVMSQEKLQLVNLTLKRCLKLIGFKVGAFNLDGVFDKDDNFLIIEIGPRNGGNLIPKAIQYATGIDLTRKTIESAIGNNDISSTVLQKNKGYFSSYVLHSIKDGIFKSVFLSEAIKNNIVYTKIFVVPEEKVSKFNDSSHTLGLMIIRFDTEKEMIEKMQSMDRYISVVLE